MVDGTGTTSYAYHAAGALGAGQVASVDGPLTNDTITYTYDQLGRVTTRAINGLNKGEIRWKIPFGEIPALVEKGLKNTGSDNYGGPGGHR